jgi:hypothetical protein
LYGNLSSGELLFEEQIRQMVHKPSSQRFRQTSNRPPNTKCMISAFFGDRFGKKRGRFAHIKANIKSFNQRIRGIFVFQDLEL